jgi:hypothetical protein
MSDPDRIVLAVPADRRTRDVVRLILGGLGARIGLSYERLDDLQLAVSRLVVEVDEQEIRLDAEAACGGVSIAVGPLVPGTGADAALLRILASLVDRVEPVTRGGVEWISLGLDPTPPRVAGRRPSSLSRDVTPVGRPRHA